MNDKAKADHETKLYQNTIEFAEQAEMIAFLNESKAELDAGQAEPALEALDRLAAKYKLTGDASV